MTWALANFKNPETAFFYDVQNLRRSYCANCSNHGHVDNKTDLSEPHYTIETEDFTFTCSGQSVFAKKYCTFNLELQRDAVLCFFCFAMCFSKFMDILTPPTNRKFWEYPVAILGKNYNYIIIRKWGRYVQIYRLMRWMLFVISIRKCPLFPKATKTHSVIILSNMK